jgi:hypothetical protein
MNTYNYFDIYTAKFIDENINKDILNDSGQLMHIYRKRFNKEYIRALIDDIRNDIKNYNHHDDEIQIKNLSYYVELFKFVNHLNIFYYV